MADQVLKTVRITDDMKVEVCQQGKKRKYALFYDSGNSDINRRRSDTDNTKSEKYDVAMSDDDVIEMALKAYNSRFGTPQKKFYITQKTYSNPAPVRTYGNGDKSPYYINNGCAINIQWVGRLTNPEFNPGTYSNLYQAEKAGRTNGKRRYLENVTITATSDDATNSDILPKSSWSVSPPIIDDLFGKDEVTVDYRDKSNVFHKVVTVTLPKGSTEGGGKGYLVWTEDGLQYESKSIPENTPVSQFSGIDKSGYGGRIGRPENQIVYFRDSDKDKDVLDRVISDFKFKVTGLQGISLADYDLKLCAPDNETCSLIPYKSPLEKSPNQAVATQPPGMTQSIPKIKFTIDGLGSEIILKAKQDLDTFTIWTGPIPKPVSLSDQFEELDELDAEYMESGYVGEEETGIDVKTWRVQDDISNGQEDSDKSLGPVGPPVEIKPVSSFDALIDLAGRCARELGKNTRVNAENMKKGYTKGIHGLCPQGTQAVLYALTGIKAVGQISGNADWFSFGPTSPGGGDNKGSFSKSGYYKDKEKIRQINGSWKGTYLHSGSKSMWQVGDVIAMAYSGGKNYGHIQVWTGYSWMSDFKQGNSIQQNHVNPDSVALWRLNDKGIAAIKSKNSNLA